MFDFTNFDPYSMDFIRKFHRNDLLEPLCEIGNIEFKKRKFKKISQIRKLFKDLKNVLSSYFLRRSQNL